MLFKYAFPLYLLFLNIQLFLIKFLLKAILQSYCHLSNLFFFYICLWQFIFYKFLMIYFCCLYLLILSTLSSLLRMRKEERIYRLFSFIAEIETLVFVYTRLERELTFMSIVLLELSFQFSFNILSIGSCRNCSFRYISQFFLTLFLVFRSNNICIRHCRSLWELRLLIYGRFVKVMEV